MDLAACQTNQIFGNSWLSKKIEKLDGLPGPGVIRGIVVKFSDCSCCVICFQRRKSKLPTQVEKTFFDTTIYIGAFSSNLLKFRAQSMDTNNVRSSLTLATLFC